MRFGLILLMLSFAALGAVFGALNSESIRLDFYLVQPQLPKGAALLCALLLGWIVGGIVVYFGLVMRLQRRVRALARELKQNAANAVAADADRQSAVRPAPRE